MLSRNTLYLFAMAALLAFAVLVSTDQSADPDQERRAPKPIWERH